jgi:hypothetical protein
MTEAGTSPAAYGCGQILEAAASIGRANGAAAGVSPVYVLLGG